MTFENLIVRVEGIAEAEAMFPEPAKLKKILANATSKGAAVYRRGVKSTAASAFKDTTTRHHPAGTLRKTIRYRRVNRLGGIAAEAGPLGKTLLKTTPLAHLVDAGHGGPHPARAHPFIEPAFAQNEDAAAAAAEAYIFAAIETALVPPVPTEG